ncbi:MAG: adenylosuccinate lyase [Vampirovibrio sp.]|nr:adenylosuccinate lyase [Vampirovibrio sp.]
MIERYALPAMATLWMQQTKYETWLEVEIAVLQAQETLGLVPAGTTEAVKTTAQFSASRIDEIEEEVKHDVIAFLTNVAEYVGEPSRFVHLGMTSSDLVDTALNLQVQRALPLIDEKLSALKATILKRAWEHKDTVMVGRSHGIHGEPITFGAKLLVWVDELNRAEARIAHAKAECQAGMVSGAMGTYAHLAPTVEAETCRLLGLTPVKASTQVIQRDRLASLFTAFALLASSLEKMATEIRNLQRTDVLEVEEGFAKGQKGSSAMPHKRNPVSSENITGLCRLIRSYAIPAMENIALWHERDISHSSVERIILPDAFIALHYVLNRFNGVMANLLVHSANMTRNMNVYGGVIFSQRVLLTLIDKGVSREIAYRLVQKNAHAAWNTEGGHFKGNLLADAEVTALLSAEDIANCFDPAPLLSNIDAVFARFPKA